MDIFYKKLDIHIQNLNAKFRAKYVIKKQMYDDIMLVLCDGWGDPQFKYWVQKHFTLVKNDDNINVVYSNDKVSRPVVTYEELYTKLCECHNRVGHHGRDKTWNEVKTQYSWIPYDVVMIFIKLCDSCIRNRQNFAKSPTSNKQIISTIDYLTRIQVYFIDMRCRPDGKFNWILHVKDHFSKFSWAYPLESKQPEYVAEKLLNQFYTFGPPCILQSSGDNGKKFVAEIIKHMRKTWTNLVIINGRSPPHPIETQNRHLIEHDDNHTLKMALEKWMQHHHTDSWSKGLGSIVYAINTDNIAKKITNKTPYEIFLKQDRSISDYFEIQKFISQSGIEDEENLPDNFIHKLNELHHSVISDTGRISDDSNDLENNNYLNTFHANNQTFHRTTPLSQSSTRTSIPNTITIADNTLAKSLERTNYTYFSDFVRLNDNTIAQDVCIVNNDISLRNSTAAAADDISNNRRKKIRHETESDHLKSVPKRQKLLYDNVVTRQQQYQLGDLVGLQIDDDRSINRTNKTPLILPCKVISIQSSLNHFTTYKLCTLKGILATLYGFQDLFDLRKFDFLNLRTVDPATLPTVTFIQACEEYIAAIRLYPVGEGSMPL